ncbi:hypothetical protein BZG36_03236 [Bifiguratus adelaidae]|uniref:Ribosome biogenesis protein NOP53 n=1 Tax=Bifiguratus adelaidae TaxID=1938954 RepID=A0A261Y050_9FUNG|nr:hypothetical protein BZG36_03236 [Bifiguratus adelaidae]
MVRNKAEGQSGHSTEKHSTFAKEKVKAQPSRKGKKEWRKNVDINDVEGGLEEKREEAKAGGPIETRPNETLFVLDTTGQTTKKPKKSNLLRVEQILAQRSAIPAIASKSASLASTSTEKGKISKWTKQQITDMANKATIPKSKRKLKADLKKAGSYDVWDDAQEDMNINEIAEGADFLPLPKAKQKKVPKTLKEKPAPLIYKPAVNIPAPGASYNPTMEEHQKLLRKAHEDEVRKEEMKQRVLDQLAYPEHLDALEDIKVDDGEEQEEDEEKDETEEADGTQTGNAQNGENKKKTKTQRNKEARQEAEAQARLARQKEKELQKSIAKAKDVQAALEEEERKKAEKLEKKRKRKAEKEVEEGGRLSKHRLKKAPLEVQLQDELSESLRGLKPEGNLFKDRFSSLQERNIIEARVPVSKKRRYKLKEVEKAKKFQTRELASMSHIAAFYTEEQSPSTVSRNEVATEDTAHEATITTTPPALSSALDAASRQPITSPHSHSPTPVPLSEDERKCWICFGEEEDSEGRWVRPCQCSLISHEECLLNWISENQKGVPFKKVRCPQCKMVYRVKEHTSWSLWFMSKVDTASNALVPYLTVLGLTCSVLVTGTTYGAYSVLTVCGSEHGEALLGSAHPWSWRVWIGLPLIPGILIASRLDILDSFMPLVPLLVVGNENMHVQWPLEPRVTICILPWLRLFYKGLYSHTYRLVARAASRNLLGTSAERRGRLSRSASTSSAPTAQTAPPTPGANAIPASGGQGDAPSGEQPFDEAQTIFNTPRPIGRTIVGALLIPAVCSVMGSLLSAISPLYRRTFANDPFHRNVFGGCIFIVCKDIAAVAYKWQKVQQRRSRSVRDYVDFVHELKEGEDDESSNGDEAVPANDEGFGGFARNMGLGGLQVEVEVFGP